MPTIGSGVKEIRIHVLGEWRVIYVAKLADAVYVLHSFQKRGQRPTRTILNWPVRGFNKLEAVYE